MKSFSCWCVWLEAEWRLMWQWGTYGAIFSIGLYFCGFPSRNPINFEFSLWGSKKYPFLALARRDGEYYEPQQNKKLFSREKYFDSTVIKPYFCLEKRHPPFSSLQHELQKMIKKITVNRRQGFKEIGWENFR